MPKHPHLIQQDKAVGDYLASLLTPPNEASAPLSQPVTASSSPEVKTSPTMEEERAAKEKDVSRLLASMPLPMQKVEPAEVEAETAEKTHCVDEAVIVAEPRQFIPETGVPSWCGSEFQALFFDVGGLTLAVPLIQLGGIHPIDNVTPLFGKPDWFKGLIHRDNEQNICIVDTAKWVMPEQYEAMKERLDYQYLILLENTPWGLACNKVSEAEPLREKDVKWRESVGKRPWLRGIVKERKCALLDVDSLVAMLNDADRNTK
tara:strand:- start:2602 stop:3384 length:783 start_codon:yes stop_codon:yes gene_type:complete